MFRNQNDTIYYIYRRDHQDERIWLVGNEEKLIQTIAGFWKPYWFENRQPNPQKISDHFNSLLDSFYCCNNPPLYKDFLIFDNFNRIIQPLDYKDISFQYYLHKNYIHLSTYKIKRRRYYLNSFCFRFDPVPDIHKWRGGPRQRMQKTRQILLDYSIPDNKSFRRGSKKIVPSDWDDKIKSRRIKNWKHQNKCRHQWQRGEKDKW